MILTEAYIVIALVIQVFGCLSSLSAKMFTGKKNVKIMSKIGLIMIGFPLIMFSNHCHGVSVRADQETAVYKFEFATNDELNIGLKLKRIPSGCKKFFLYYVTDSNQTARTKGMIDDTITFTKKLVGVQKIQYYIDLTDNNGVFCTRKQILDGKRSENRIPSTNCLKPGRKCEIAVDFENKCDEKEGPKKNFCSFVLPSSYVCEYGDQPEGTLQQWHQIINYGVVDIDIGMITPVKATKTKFIINLMKFDNNSKIYNEMETDTIKFNTTKNNIIFLPNDSINPYNITKIISYNELQYVNFDCSNASNHLINPNNVTVGAIDPTGNRIMQYRSPRLEMKFPKKYNRMMLCCIYHVIDYISSVVEVHRYVESVSLLIYKAEEIQEKNKTTNWMPSHVDGGEDDPQVIFYYIIGVVGSIILLVIITIIMKKINCCTKRNQEETVALQTYANPNAVLYADLDIRSTDNRQVTTNTTEESPYAEIIGVLKPK